MHFKPNLLNVLTFITTRQYLIHIKRILIEIHLYIDLKRIVNIIFQSKPITFNQMPVRAAPVIMVRL